MSCVFRTKWISTFLWLLAAIGTIHTQVLYGDVKFNYEALLNSYKVQLSL